jgi:chromosome segregation ATPase
MTVEEITQTLERVADNQARHDEIHERHKADIAEMDRMIAANIESLNRHDRQLDRLFELVGVLGERQLENETRFAELVESNKRAAERIEKLEGSYDLLESFVRSVREEARDYFAETDRKLARLADVQAETAGLVAAFVKESNGRFAETDRRLAEFVSETDRRFSILERDGSTKAKKKTAAKKSKKGRNE